MKFDFDLRFRNLATLALCISLLLICSWTIEAKGPYDIPLTINQPPNLVAMQDTVPGKDNIGKYLTRPDQKNPFDLKNPPLLQEETQYAPQSNSYNFINRLGDEYRPYSPTMTFSCLL